MNKRLKLTLTLFIIGGLSGLLISQVNTITAPIIKEMQEQKELNLYKEIFPELDSFDKVVVEEGSVIEYAELKDSEGVVVGYVYKTFANNSYGSITTLVGLSADGLVKDIKYSTFSQTPGFGDKVKNPEFMDQFKDVDASSLTVDYVSGATYSSILVDDLVHSAIEYHGGVK
jgi:electron transport complex protein RnfG